MHKDQAAERLRAKGKGRGIYEGTQPGNTGRWGGEFRQFDKARDPRSYEADDAQVKKGRCTHGADLEYEPEVENGVVRCQRDGNTYEQSDWFWMPNVNPSRDRSNDFRTRTYGGRRSRNTLRLEGIFTEVSARDYVMELWKFGPIQGIVFIRDNNHHGMTGLGYVHFKFSKDATKCAEDFSMVNYRGNKSRICFARYCAEEFDLLKMSEEGNGETTYTVSLEANQDTIMGYQWSSWGEPNFGCKHWSR